jgi:hypothetical protein
MIHELPEILGTAYPFLMLLLVRYCILLSTAPEVGITESDCNARLAPTFLEPWSQAKEAFQVTVLRITPSFFA